MPQSARKLPAGKYGVASLVVSFLVSFGCQAAPSPAQMGDVEASDGQGPDMADVQLVVDAKPELPTVVADANKETSDSCHTDCFGGWTCENGKVVYFTPKALPCGTGRSCPSKVVHSCSQGCNPHAVYKGGNVEPLSFCAEYPKVPGDACDSDAQCQPVAPPVGLTATALTCDLTVHGCVWPGAPKLDDYLADCGLDEEPFAKSKYGGNTGFVPVSSCGAQVCFVSFTNNVGWGPNYPQCVVQKCTKPCLSNWDCPIGSRCLTGPAVSATTGEVTASATKGCLPIAQAQILDLPGSLACKFWK